ncbi:hypothetical protein [Zobellia uliginosa]|uniref:hypothetical protein n=1 Tax=Zobellia uliginosa TaxID=143224 RepID=UPI0026E392D2|nr:hypothetical protein [Zobellia uliginosa]
MINKIFSALILLTSFDALGQDVMLEEINKKVNRIKTDTTLTITISNGSKGNLDGGYGLKVWHRQNDIVKIEEEIGLSYGRIKTTLYLENLVPIKIIEVEENFSQSPTGLNYKKLDTVYKCTRYIVNWKQGRGITKTKGNPSFSIPKKSVHDYNSWIEKAQWAIGKPQ